MAIINTVEWRAYRLSVLVGVDVGASHSEVAITSGAATTVARNRGPGIGIRPGFVASAVETIRIMIETLTQDATSTGQHRCVVVGAAGAHTQVVRSEMESALARAFPNATIHVTTDGEIALESAFGTSPGIVVCAGSGSIAYARDPTGVVRRAGGLGPILADDGSGYEIGRAGLRVAARAADGRSVGTSLAKAIFAAAGVSTLNELVDWAWEAGRPTVAGLAEIVCREAHSGDEAARKIVDNAARELGQLGATLARHFGADLPFDLALGGGVLSPGSPVRSALVAYLRKELTSSRIIEEPVDPVAGALAIAKRMSPS
jgi:N-acetylglucosamine kinase-like BadF-type ATPase